MLDDSTHEMEQDKMVILMSSTTGHIHVIARAVIRVGDMILIAHAKGSSNTFLPGGHVRIGERMHDAIARELKEEFGHPCVVRNYLGAVEHTFAVDGVTQHEVSHFFKVTLPDVEGTPHLPSFEDHLEFSWKPVAELHEANLMPEPAIALAASDGSFWASTIDIGDETTDCM